MPPSGRESFKKPLGSIGHVHHGITFRRIACAARAIFADALVTLIAGAERIALRGQFLTTLIAKIKFF